MHRQLHVHAHRGPAPGPGLDVDVRNLPRLQVRQVPWRRHRHPVRRGSPLGQRVQLRLVLGIAVLRKVPEVLGAAQVDLVGPSQRESPLLQEPQQRAVHDGRPELAGQVVSRQGQPGRRIPAQKLRVAGHRVGGGIDERRTRLERRLRVGQRRLRPAAGRRVEHHLDPAQRAAFRRAVAGFIANPKAGEGFSPELRMHKLVNMEIWSLSWAQDSACDLSNPWLRRQADTLRIGRDRAGALVAAVRAEATLPPALSRGRSEWPKRPASCERRTGPAS